MVERVRPISCVTTGKSEESALASQNPQGDMMDFAVTIQLDTYPAFESPDLAVYLRL